MKRGGRRGVNPIFQAEKGRQEEKVWDEDEVLHRHVEWAAKLGDAAALYQLRLSALTEPGNPERRVEPEREMAAHILDTAIDWHVTPQEALARIRAREYAYPPGGEIENARRVAGDMRDPDPAAAGEEEEKEEQALVESSVEGDSWADDPLAMHADLIL